MIEKCATLTWKFYGEMDAEDEIDNDNMEEDSDDSSVDTQDEALEAPDAVIEAPGDQGGDSGSEEEEIGPLEEV
jgi:hypothetical protein